MTANIAVDVALVMYILHQIGCRLSEAIYIAQQPLDRVKVVNSDLMHASYHTGERLTTADMVTKTSAYKK